MRQLIIIGLFTLQTTYGQGKIETRKVPVEKMTVFIDSLKDKIINDTVKFDRKDLIHSNLGTRNTKSYSSLFIVDMKYEYLLDIINGKKVNEFINEFLDPKKIKAIDVFSIRDSQAMFGTKGTNGTILIQINKGIKKRFDVAGLKIKNKKAKSDNFAQRKDGELKIEH